MTHARSDIADPARKRTKISGIEAEEFGVFIIGLQWVPGHRVLDRALVIIRQERRDRRIDLVARQSKNALRGRRILVARKIFPRD